MRPVNLIPQEQQVRGRGLGVGRTGFAPYIVLGFLGLAVIGVAAVVLTSNSVNSKDEEVARLQAETVSAKATADALRPYGNFAQVTQARVDTVNSLVSSTFNWERVLRSLARTIPSNVWLTSFTGTVNPDVKLEAGGGGGGASGGSRGQTRSPAVQLVGCTYSHSAVAKMMVAMRNLDDVSEVVLESSEKPDQTGSGVGESSSGGGGGSGDCRTTDKITKYEILVVIGHDKTQAAAASAASTAAAPTSPTAAAQGAATTASTSTTGGTP
jgi:hypothetical protein